MTKKPKPAPKHLISLSEYSAINQIPSVNKRGFQFWLIGHKGSVGTHTLSEWEKLYENFLKS